MKTTVVCLNIISQTADEDFNTIVRELECTGDIGIMIMPTPAKDKLPEYIVALNTLAHCSVPSIDTLLIVRIDGDVDVDAINEEIKKLDNTITATYWGPTDENVEKPWSLDDCRNFALAIHDSRLDTVHVKNASNSIPKASMKHLYLNKCQLCNAATRSHNKRRGRP